jgi:hypothetical protein
VADYLNAHTVYIGGLSIMQTGAGSVSRAACNCKTGKTIYVTTLNTSHLKKSYTDLGFTQE